MKGDSYRWWAPKKEWTPKTIDDDGTRLWIMESALPAKEEDSWNIQRAYANSSMVEDSTVAYSIVEGLAVDNMVDSTVVDSMVEQNIVADSLTEDIDEHLRRILIRQDIRQNRHSLNHD